MYFAVALTLISSVWLTNASIRYVELETEKWENNHHQDIVRVDWRSKRKEDIVNETLTKMNNTLSIMSTSNQNTQIINRKL